MPNAVFRQVDPDDSQTFEQIIEIAQPNAARLFDDFFNLEQRAFTHKITRLINCTLPYFWTIHDPKTSAVAGFVYLYDLVGCGDFVFSASIATCFRRKYWGKFARGAAREFFAYAADVLKIYRLNAEVFRPNTYPKRFLRDIGFKYSYSKPQDTLNSRLSPLDAFCDIDVFTLELTNPKENL